MKILKRLTAWIRSSAGKGPTIARKIRLAWKAHVDRMTSEPGYARAAQELLQAAVRLVLPSYSARYIADQALTAYVALLRLLRPPRWDGHDDLDWI